MLLEMLVQAIMILVNRKGDCAKFQDGAKKLMNKILVSKIDATIIHSRKGKVQFSSCGKISRKCHDDEIQL